MRASLPVHQLILVRPIIYDSIFLVSVEPQILLRTVTKSSSLAFFSSSGLCLSCGGGSGCVGGSYQNLKAACVLVCWSRIEQSQCVSVTGSSDH